MGDTRKSSVTLFLKKLAYAAYIRMSPINRTHNLSISVLPTQKKCIGGNHDDMVTLFPLLRTQQRFVDIGKLIHM